MSVKSTRSTLTCPLCIPVADRQRASEALGFLLARPETHIAVVSHTNFIRQVSHCPTRHGIPRVMVSHAALYPALTPSQCLLGRHNAAIEVIPSTAKPRLHAHFANAEVRLVSSPALHTCQFAHTRTITHTHTGALGRAPGWTDSWHVRGYAVRRQRHWATAVSRRGAACSALAARDFPSVCDKCPPLACQCAPDGCTY